MCALHGRRSIPAGRGEARNMSAGPRKWSVTGNMSKTHLLGLVVVGLVASVLGYPLEGEKKAEEGPKGEEAQRRSEQEYAWSHQKIELKEHHEDPKLPHHHHQQQHEQVKALKKVPKPYPVEVEKKVPYEVKVPVDRPYPVYIPQPYPVYIEKKVPFEVKVPVPQPFTIEKVPYEVKLEKTYPLPVEKPYTVYVQKKIIEKRIPYTVKVEKHYPEAGVEKGLPYHVEKVIHYPVKVDQPEPYYFEKPYGYSIEKKVPYQTGGYRSEKMETPARAVPQVTEDTDEGEPLPRPAAFRQEGQNVFSDTEEFVSTTVQVKDPKEDQAPEPVSTSYAHSSLSQGQASYTTNIQHY